MTKRTTTVLATAFLPLFAHAHSTSTSGSPLHALQHGALALGYVAAIALASFAVFQLVRKWRAGK
ncbi:MAG: hypothetical protein HRT56_02435 [Coraliomargarita sp.]|nr:hypothetical protein [Coraliomargarita sp.]